MNNNKKIILDLCGGTGSWSKPYVESGYDVRNITLPEYDVRLYIPTQNVYGILAAPPCTHLAVSGARWWKEKGEVVLLEALSIVDACIRIVHVCKPKFWCLENPIGRLVKYLGKPKMYFQPWEYGDPYTKKTALWGNFFIPQKNPCKPEYAMISSGKYNGKYKRRKSFPSKMHLLPPSRDRQLLRSITPQGFAKAFFEANQ